MPMIVLLLHLLQFIHDAVAGSSKEEDTIQDNKVEVMAERQQQFLHEIDSINILIYTTILCLTVVTVYLFRRKQIRFFHESGMIMIYGLIVGLAVKLSESVHHRRHNVKLTGNTSDIVTPPVLLRLGLPKSHNQSAFFTYKLSGASKEGESEFEETATFDPEIFFNVMLPPILFHAGYSLKRKHFFRNIGSIMAFAFFGTATSCMVVGGIMFGIAKLAKLGFDITQCLFFGALISATDPVTVLSIFNELHVDVDLYALVFGESALNDAVAIVLSRTVEPFLTAEENNLVFDAATVFRSIGSFLGVFFGSFGVGALMGCLCALLTKFSAIRDMPNLETALFILMSYMSFLIAESTQMTGIVAVLFCGITQAHYTYNNLSKESQIRTKQFFDILNFLSESFIFTYIGVSMFTSQAHRWSPPFILGSFFAILVGRAIFVYPLCFIMNLRRKPPIPASHQHMLFFSGLRGAIAFAIAIRNTTTFPRQIIYTTTSLIVICTVIFNGSLTAYMLDWLKIRIGVDSDAELTPQLERPEPENDTSTAAENHHYNPWDKSFLPRKWYNFDSQFMKPLLTHSRPNLMETLPHCCFPLAKLLTSTQQISTRDLNSATNSEQDLVNTTGHEQVDIFAPPSANSYTQPSGAHNRSRSLEDLPSSLKLNVFLPDHRGQQL